MFVMLGIPLYDCQDYFNELEYMLGPDNLNKPGIYNLNMVDKLDYFSKGDPSPLTEKKELQIMQANLYKNTDANKLLNSIAPKLKLIPEVYDFKELHTSIEVYENTGDVYFINHHLHKKVKIGNIDESFDRLPISYLSKYINENCLNTQFQYVLCQVPKIDKDEDSDQFWIYITMNIPQEIIELLLAQTSSRGNISFFLTESGTLMISLYDNSLILTPDYDISNKDSLAYYVDIENTLNKRLDKFCNDTITKRNRFSPVFNLLDKKLKEFESKVNYSHSLNRLITRIFTYKTNKYMKNQPANIYSVLIDRKIINYSSKIIDKFENKLREEVLSILLSGIAYISKKYHKSDIPIYSPSKYIYNSRIYQLISAVDYGSYASIFSNQIKL